MAKLDRRMDTIINPCRFGDSNPVATVSFLKQFLRAYDSNQASEGVAKWLLPFLVAKSPVALLSILLTPTKDVDASALVRRKIEIQKHIYT